MNEQLLADVSRIIDTVSAEEVMPRWRNLGARDISEKSGPDDLVTVADQAAEKALTQHLTALLPGSTVVGEEAVTADESVIGRLAHPGPVWVIDPIDGTQAFATGEPDFTIMIALVEESRPVAGWIVAPALGIAMQGGPGMGVTYQARNTPGRRLPPLVPPGDLKQLVGLLGKRNITEARRAELQAREHHFKALDGVTYAGIDYMRLARGEAHFALYSKCQPWDHLPGLALVSALGFAHSRHDGTPYQPHAPQGGILVAPSGSFDEIRDRLMA